MTSPTTRKARAVLEAIGGVANVVEIDPCTTRLRALVEDPALVNCQALRAAGAHGVMRTGRVVQIVIGPEVDNLATALEDLM
ncbi:glucose PTS transporter subunit EIIB [Xylanimonas ulmi]|uniref:PTS system N-acetylglucosamine-specific IIB component (Glc family) n=1 Tax=Xylanimonas ulmi TaxID=228973 RepID=A0A4Q7M2F9_9MICO|nr:glucose PTS transporter subunit EIIB [Xylanibacterium ulmi]RZS62065.1 PTS system N-acetylglucosamine-specific IIB component (Glc family) [Xylanibacterium ulmi]